MAQNAGDKVKQSVSAIEQTSQLMRDITSSSEEQSSGISQVNIAVNQMDQVTQQNAVLVEESASSADELAARRAVTYDGCGVPDCIMVLNSRLWAAVLFSAFIPRYA